MLQGAVEGSRAHCGVGGSMRLSLQSRLSVCLSLLVCRHDMTFQVPSLALLSLYFLGFPFYPRSQKLWLKSLSHTVPYCDKLKAPPGTTGVGWEGAPLLTPSPT